MNKILIPSDRGLSVYNWFVENAGAVLRAGFKIPFDEGVLVFTTLNSELDFKVVGDTVLFALHVLHDHNADFEFTFNVSYGTTELVRSPLSPHETESVLQAQKELAVIFCGAISLIVYHKDAVAESLIRVKEPKPAAKNSRHKSKSKSKSKPAKPQTQHIYVLQSFEPKEATKKLKAAKRKYTKPTTEVQVRGHYRTYPSGKRVWVKPFTKYNGKKSNRDKEYIL